jgi:hypothetical protein
MLVACFSSFWKIRVLDHILRCPVGQEQGRTSFGSHLVLSKHGEFSSYLCYEHLHPHPIFGPLGASPAVFSMCKLAIIIFTSKFSCLLLLFTFLELDPIEQKQEQQTGGGFLIAYTWINHYDGPIRSTEQQSDYMYSTLPQQAVPD